MGRLQVSVKTSLRSCNTDFKHFSPISVSFYTLFIPKSSELMWRIPPPIKDFTIENFKDTFYPNKKKLIIFRQGILLCSHPLLKYINSIKCNTVLLSFFLRICSDIFRLLEDIFRPNIKEYIHTNIRVCVRAYIRIYTQVFKIFIKYDTHTIITAFVVYFNTIFLII